MTLLAAEDSYYRGFAARTQRTHRFVNSTVALKAKSLDKTKGIEIQLSKDIHMVLHRVWDWFDETFGFKQPATKRGIS
ncbi:hypothetical protein [Enterovibrio norvegicus]|uniref:hypothetical protein n=1 Tax=Enterovibrio norvegicus TaxID=188144 RepID=UPI003552304F